MGLLFFLFKKIIKFNFSNGMQGNGDPNGVNVLIHTSMVTTNLNGNPITKIACGTSHTCVIANYSVFCTGQNK